MTEFNAEGEPQETAAPSAEDDVAAEAGAAAPQHGFGDDAAEMANETEVEAPVELSPAEEIALLKIEVAERTLDAQRIQAEYANYRKRVDRDRVLDAENAAYKVLAPIVEVLDTIDRAREHGDLSEDLKQVADQLERVVSTQGLTRFGEVGEAFDPQLHEALSHLGTDAEVEVTTIKLLAKAGYRIGDRVVRAAQVLVVDPA